MRQHPFHDTEPAKFSALPHDRALTAAPALGKSKSC